MADRQPKKLAPYLVFSGEVRESVKQELIANGNPKPTMGDIAKVVAERWKLVSDEEKTVRARFLLTHPNLALPFSFEALLQTRPAARHYPPVVGARGSLGSPAQRVNALQRFLNAYVCLPPESAAALQGNLRSEDGRR